MKTVTKFDGQRGRCFSEGLKERRFFHFCLGHVQELRARMFLDEFKKLVFTKWFAQEIARSGGQGLTAIFSQDAGTDRNDADITPGSARIPPNGLEAVHARVCASPSGSGRAAAIVQRPRLLGCRLWRVLVSNPIGSRKPTSKSQFSGCIVHDENRQHAGWRPVCTRGVTKEKWSRLPPPRGSGFDGDFKPKTGAFA